MKQELPNMSNNNLETTKCQICENESFNIQYPDVKNRLNVSETFTIVQCSKCGFMFLNPRPDQKTIIKYYDLEEYHPHNVSEESMFDRIYSKVRKININAKRKLINKLFDNSGSLLDIGCGTGEFLQHMQENDWNVQGMETAEGARDMAAENGIKISENLSQVKDSFDVVTMWHVFEHIHDIDELMKNIHRILNDEGYLILTVPNINSQDAGYYKSEWIALDAPRHLYHFRPEDMILLLKKHNFKLEKIHNKLHFDVWYNVLLSAQLKGKIKGKNATILDYIIAGIIGKISFFYGLINKKKTTSPVYIAKKFMYYY